MCMISGIFERAVLPCFLEEDCCGHGTSYLVAAKAICHFAIWLNITHMSFDICLEAAYLSPLDLCRAGCLDP